MIIGIFGQTGSGKTYTIKRIIAQTKRKILVIDKLLSFSDFEKLQIVYKIENLRVGKNYLIIPADNDIDNLIKYIINFENYLIIIDELALFRQGIKFYSWLTLHRHLRQTIVYATQRPVSFTAQSRCIFDLTNQYIFCKTTQDSNLLPFKFLDKQDKRKIRELIPPNFISFQF